MKKDVVVKGATSPATSNLETALLDLIDVGTPLWIDVIGIEQGDLQEKQERIPRMGEIYSLAAHVTIWRDPSKALVDKLWHMLERFPEGNARFFVPPSSYRLTGSPWFRRVWSVVDKSLLAPEDPTFRCGHHIVAWTNFDQAFPHLIDGWGVHSPIPAHLVKTCLETGSRCPGRAGSRICRFGRSETANCPRCGIVSPLVEGSDQIRHQ